LSGVAVAVTQLAGWHVVTFSLCEKKVLKKTALDKAHFDEF